MRLEEPQSYVAQKNIQTQTFVGGKLFKLFHDNGRGPYLSYRNRSTDLHSKSMDWFLYDRDLRHQRVQNIIRTFLGHKSMMATHKGVLVTNNINPLMHNVPTWSDTLQKSCSICCKIFKVSLTISGNYALKG